MRLDEENGRSLYVPERFAHGYQTLVDDDGDELLRRRVLHARRRGRPPAATIRGSGSAGRCPSSAISEKDARGSRSTRSSPSCAGEWRSA